MLKTPIKKPMLCRRSGSMIELNSPKKGFIQIKVEASTPFKIFNEDNDKDSLKLNIAQAASVNDTCASSSARYTSTEN